MREKVQALSGGQKTGKNVRHDKIRRFLTLIFDNVDSPASTSPLSTCVLSSTRSDCGFDMILSAFFCFRTTTAARQRVGMHHSSLQDFDVRPSSAEACRSSATLLSPARVWKLARSLPWVRGLILNLAPLPRISLQ